MSHTAVWDAAALAVAVSTPFLVASFAAVGYMLRRLINNSDAATTRRLDRIEKDQAGLAKRQDESMQALNDLIREGFDLASTDRNQIARDLGERLARVEGHLGWTKLRTGTD